MEWFIKINEENRIIALCKYCGSYVNFIKVTIPKEIDLNNIHNYLYINGSFIYSEIEVPEIEPVTSIEDRVLSLEESVDDLIYQSLFGE